MSKEQKPKTDPDPDPKTDPDPNTSTTAPVIIEAIHSKDSVGRRLPLPKKWEHFLGYMYSDTRYLVKGGEGSRKSTFMLKFAAMCGRMGNVLYVLAEEKLKSGTVQKRERLAKVNLCNVYYLETPTFEQLDEALASGKYQFVIIDSVNMMESDEHPADEIMKLWERHRIVFAYVMQMLKDRKEYRGSSAMRHYVDVVIETEKTSGKYYACITGKNRFRHATPVEKMEI